MEGTNDVDGVLVEKFREQVKDVLQPQHDDEFLKKWIRARGRNLSKAETMLRESLEWREKVGADSILTTYDPPEVLKLYFPGGLFGYAKDGSPVWIDTMGRADVRECHEIPIDTVRSGVSTNRSRDSYRLYRCCKRSELIKHKIYHCEQVQHKLKQQELKLNKKVTGFILINDLDGFGMKHLWKPNMETTAKVLKMFEANYPESIKSIYVINAPKIFPIAYNLMKHFLSEDTHRKLNILGSDWKTKLLEVIDADQLPKHWGGDLVGQDGDEFCRSLGVQVASEIPESYYQDLNILSESDNLEIVTVGRGSTEQVEKVISEPGAVIRWKFTTACNDIGFGVFLRTTNGRQKAGEMKEIIPSQRVNSHLVPEDGAITCDEAGTYVLRFDNTYSWISSKKVTYLIEVMQVNDQSATMGSAPFDDVQNQQENSQSQ